MSRAILVDIDLDKLSWNTNSKFQCILGYIEKGKQLFWLITKFWPFYLNLNNY